jgi:flagellar FliL protein
MAKKDKQETNGEQEPKKGGKLKLIIIILVALIILGGGGFAAYMFLFKKSPPPPAPAQNNGQQQQQQQAQAQAAPPIVKKKKILPQTTLDPFIVNLADKNARRYLKVKVALELSDEKLKDEIKERTPEIRDLVTLLLSSKTYADISTFDGKLALKTELMSRLNAILINGRVTNVFFVDFVVQ